MKNFLNNIPVGLSILIAIAASSAFVWTGMSGPAFGNHVACWEFGCLSPIVWPTLALSPFLGWLSYIPHTVFQYIDTITTYWPKIIIGAIAKDIILIILASIPFFLALVIWRTITSGESYLRIRKIFFTTFTIGLIFYIFSLAYADYSWVTGAALPTANLCINDTKCEELLNNSKVLDDASKTGLSFPYISPFEFVRDNEDMLSVEVKNIYCDINRDPRPAFKDILGGTLLCRDGLDILDASSLPREQCIAIRDKYSHIWAKYSSACALKLAPAVTLLDVDKFYSLLRTTSRINISNFSGVRQGFITTRYYSNDAASHHVVPWGDFITGFNFTGASHYFEVIQGAPEDVKQKMDSRGFFQLPKQYSNREAPILQQNEWMKEEIIGGVGVTYISFEGKENDKIYWIYQATFLFNDSLVAVHMKVPSAPSSEAYKGIPERDFEKALKTIIQILVQSQK